MSDDDLMIFLAAYGNAISQMIHATVALLMSLFG